MKEGLPCANNIPIRKKKKKIQDKGIDAASAVGGIIPVNDHISELVPEDIQHKVAKFKRTRGTIERHETFLAPLKVEGKETH